MKAGILELALFLEIHPEKVMGLSLMAQLLVGFSQIDFQYTTL